MSGTSNCTVISPEKVAKPAMQFSEKCAKDPVCPLGLLTFDKQCDGAQRQKALSDSYESCFKDPFDLYSNALNDYFKHDGKLDDISPCKTMKKVLEDCFVKNDCFSQREMDLVRNMAAAAYHRGMGSLALVEKEFGTFTDFIDSHNNLTLQWHDHKITFPNVVNVSDPTTKKSLDLVDHVIKDYNADYCAVNQKDFERMAKAMEETSTTDPGNGSSAHRLNLLQWILPFSFMLKFVFDF